MKQFKKEDSVVNLLTGERGEVSTVLGNNYFFVDGDSVYKNYLLTERDYVARCIKALRERGIGLNSNPSDPKPCYLFKGNVAQCFTIAGLLNKLYPQETEQQKKLRELEEKQRAIADEIAKLRGEM